MFYYTVKSKIIGAIIEMFDIKNIKTFKIGDIKIIIKINNNFIISRSTSSHYNKRLFLNNNQIIIRGGRHL